MVDVLNPVALGHLEHDLLETDAGLHGRAQAHLGPIDRRGDEVDEQQLVRGEPAGGVTQRGGPADPVDQVRPACRVGSREQHVRGHHQPARRRRPQQRLHADLTPAGQGDDRLVDGVEAAGLVREQGQQIGMPDPGAGRGQRRRRQSLGQHRDLGQILRAQDHAPDLGGLHR
jgi:hypothetical protein